MSYRIKVSALLPDYYNPTVLQASARSSLDTALAWTQSSLSTNILSENSSRQNRHYSMAQMTLQVDDFLNALHYDPI